MNTQELLKQIKSGENTNFIFNEEKQIVTCRCGYVAIWLQGGYTCGTITAYPCEYNRIHKKC